MTVDAVPAGECPQPTPRMLVVDSPTPHTCGAFVSTKFMGLPFWSTDDAGPGSSPKERRAVFGSLDVHHYLVQHPAATFFLRMSGNALRGEHVRDGDVLAVDRSRVPAVGDLAVFVHEAEMYVRPLARFDGRWCAEIDGQRVLFTQDTDLWGVVCGVIRKL